MKHLAVILRLSLQWFVYSCITVTRCLWSYGRCWQRRRRWYQSCWWASLFRDDPIHGQTTWLPLPSQPVCLHFWWPARMLTITANTDKKLLRLCPGCCYSSATLLLTHSRPTGRESCFASITCRRLRWWPVLISFPCCWLRRLSLSKVPSPLPQHSLPDIHSSLLTCCFCPRHLQSDSCSYFTLLHSLVQSRSPSLWQCVRDLLYYYHVSYTITLSPLSAFWASSSSLLLYLLVFTSISSRSRRNDLQPVGRMPSNVNFQHCFVSV